MSSVKILNLSGKFSNSLSKKGFSFCLKNKQLYDALGNTYHMPRELFRSLKSDKSGSLNFKLVKTGTVKSVKAKPASKDLKKLRAGLREFFKPEKKEPKKTKGMLGGMPVVFWDYGATLPRPKKSELKPAKTDGVWPHKIENSWTSSPTPPKMTTKYIYDGNSISFIKDGAVYQTSAANPMFSKVFESVKAGKYDKAIELSNIASSIEKASKGLINNDGGVLKCGGVPLNEKVQDWVFNNVDKGHSAMNSVVNFMARLKNNPKPESVDQLWRFLRMHNLILLPDGRFIGYKYVTPDFKDCHTKSIDNSVGKVVSMPRDQVAFDPNQTCASGLHFCSEEYSYLKNASTVVEVAVCPSMVVSVPSDHNDTKCRCCEYTVWKVIREKGVEVAPKTKQSDFFKESL